MHTRFTDPVFRTSHVWPVLLGILLTMLCYRFMLSQKSSASYLKLYDAEIVPLLLRRPASTPFYSTLQCTGAAATANAQKKPVQRQHQEREFIRSSRYLFHTSSFGLRENKPAVDKPVTTSDEPQKSSDATNETVAKPEDIPLIDPATEKLGLFARFKKMYKEYWYVLLPVHVITSAGWLGGFYYLSKRWEVICVLWPFI